MTLQDRIDELSAAYLAAFFRQDHNEARRLADDLEAARATQRAASGLPLAATA